MIARVLTLVAGLGGAASFAQFPEFSQQYVQRLGGAVDALQQVVADFDSSAAAEGLTRVQALEQMTGSAFVTRRRADMERSFARYDSLRTGLGELQTAGPFMRAYHMADVDREIAQAAWDAYEPAMPLNFAGLIFGLCGFIFGGAIVGGLLGGLGRIARFFVAAGPRSQSQ